MALLPIQYLELFTLCMVLVVIFRIYRAHSEEMLSPNNARPLPTIIEEPCASIQSAKPTYPEIKKSSLMAREIEIIPFNLELAESPKPATRKTQENKTSQIEAKTPQCKKTMLNNYISDFF